MRIYLKNSVKFHPDPIRYDGALGLSNSKSVAVSPEQDQEEQKEE